MRRRAFTLIELLVVIAIISIIAAIVFHVFASVHDKALQTACISNLKQLGMAEMLYLDDYDDTFWATPEPGLHLPRVLLVEPTAERSIRLQTLCR